MDVFSPTLIVSFPLSPFFPLSLKIKKNLGGKRGPDGDLDPSGSRGVRKG